MDFTTIIDVSKNSEISSIKETITNILQIINDPVSGAKDLKEIIEVDPPLTVKLLKLANSAYYAPTNPITGIQEAIVTLGFDAVRELAISQKVCQLFANSDTFHGYSRLELWKHCLAVAILGKLIYRREFRKKGDDIYVCGLLHDLGLIVLDQFNHDEFQNVLSNFTKDNKNLTEVEDNILKYNHAEIAMNLCLEWEIPEDITYAIGFHHKPGEVDEEYEFITRTLYVANYVIQENKIGYCDMQKPSEVIYKKCLAKLKIDSKSIAFFLKDVKNELAKLEENGFLG